MKFNTFNSSNPEQVTKYLPDGSTELGKFLLGEDGVPRFFTLKEISAMTGVGVYSPVTGYSEYVSKVTEREMKITNPVFLAQVEENAQE